MFVAFLLLSTRGHIGSGLQGFPNQLDIFRRSGAKGGLDHTGSVPTTASCLFCINTDPTTSITDGQSNLADFKG